MVIPERETLLHVAIHCGSEDIVKYIVKEGMADIEARTIPEEVSGDDNDLGRCG